MTTVAKSELDAVARRAHAEPPPLPGAPRGDDAVVGRAFRPSAQTVAVKPSRGKAVEMKCIHPAGIFEAELPGAKLPLRYRLKVDYGPGGKFTVEDPYA